MPLILTLGLCSLGCVIYPRPVQLDTVCGPAIHWQDNDTAETFNAKVVHALQTLVKETNAKEYKCNRASHKYRDPLLQCLYGCCMALQNLFFFVLIMVLIWPTFVPLLIWTLWQKIREKKNRSKSKKMVEEDLPKSDINSLIVDHDNDDTLMKKDGKDNNKKKRKNK